MEVLEFRAGLVEGVTLCWTGATKTMVLGMGAGGLGFAPAHDYKTPPTSHTPTTTTTTAAITTTRA